MSFLEKLKERFTVKDLIVHLMLLSYVFLSIFNWPGYTLEFEDQLFYTPPIKHAINPELFTNDFLVQNTQVKMSIYDEIVAFVAQDEANLYHAYFYLTILSRYLLFLGVYLMVLALTKNRVVSVISIAFMSLVHVGGVCNAIPAFTWIFSYATELHARSLATSVLVLALGLFLYGKRHWAWLLLILGTLIHIISATFMVALFVLLTLTGLKQKSQRKDWYQLGYLGLLFLALMAFISSSDGGSFDMFTIADGKWYEIIRGRAVYIFMDYYSSIWQMMTIWGSVIGLLSFFAYSYRRQPLIRNLAICSLAIFSFFVMIHAIGGEVYQLALVLQLQFLRNIIWLRIILFGLVVYVFYDLVSYWWRQMFPADNKPLSIKAPWLKEGVFGLDTNISYPWALLFLIGGTIASYIQGFYFHLPLLVLLGILSLKEYWYQRWYKNLVFSVWMISIFFGLHWANVIDIARFTDTDTLLASTYVLNIIRFLVAIIFPGAVFVFLCWLIQKLSLPKIIKKHSRVVTEIVFALVVLIFAGTLTHLIKVSDDHIRSNPCENSYVIRSGSCDLVTWLQDNLTEEDLLLLALPKDYGTAKGRFFRSTADVNIFVQVIEGGQVVFDREFAIEWARRMNFAYQPSAYLGLLIDYYGVNYFLVENDSDEYPRLFAQPRLRQVIQSKKFTLFGVRGMPKEEQKNVGQ